MTDREAMKMALAKLEHLWEIGIDAEYKVELLPEIEVLRQALAQPEQEHKPWVSLTDEEIGDVYVAWDNTEGASFADFARLIETKSRSKNNG